MDGEETLRRILQFDPNARVIMLTASEHKQLIQKCLRDGAIGFLTKPFSAKELLDIMTNAVKIGYEKNTNSLFALICGKIDASVKKIFGNDVSVSLRETSTIQLNTERTSNNIWQSKATSEINEHRLEIQPETIVYICEFSGQRNGIVLSLIDDKDLGELFGKPRVKGMDLDSRNLSHALELFNIINQKVLSEIVTATHLRVKPDPTRLYHASRDKLTFKDEVFIARWEITRGDNSISIETRFGFTS